MLDSCDRIGQGSIKMTELSTERDTQPVEALDAADAPHSPKAAQKVGRNAPCPCGSGRAFKRCCGEIGRWGLAS